MLFDYTAVLVLILVGCANLVLMLVIPKLLRPLKPTEQKLIAYECGENPIGTGWLQYNVRFFSTALIFIVFDVEIVFMYPWAIVFKDLHRTQGSLPFVEMLTFVVVLLVGLAYLWHHGLLDWVRSVSHSDRTARHS